MPVSCQKVIFLIFWKTGAYYSKDRLMQLHYVWIKKLFELEQQELLFSPELLISFDGEVLTIRDRKPLPNGFFENSDIPEEFKKDKPADIFNLSLLLGRNGAGKSTVINYLQESLSSGSNLPVTNGAIIVYTKEAGPGPKTLFVYDTESSIKEIKHHSKRFSKPKPDNEFEFDKNKLSVVKYANTLDLNTPIGDWAGLHDISTNWLLRKAPEDRSNNTTIVISETESFKIEEIQRNVQFVSSQYKELLPFSSPEELNIQISDMDLNMLMKDIPTEITESREIAMKIHKLLQKEEANEKAINLAPQRFMRRLRVAVMLNFIRNHIHFSSDQSIFGAYLKKLNWNSIQELTEDFFNDIQKGGLGDTGRGSVKNVLGFLDWFRLYVINTVETDHAMGRFGIPFSIYMNIEEDGGEQFRNFIKLYLDSFALTGFLTFNWHQLSSGQQSMLSLFSRFYQLHDEIQKSANLRLKKNVIILIDEGATYYHPEWERRFIHDLLRFLPYIMEGDRTIQVIIAANSPLMASDVPMQNIILFTPSSSGETLDSSYSETFGANIHQLLAHAFFMESTTGKFAEEVIQDLINYLIGNSGQGSRIDDRATAQDYIHLIGEPILRNELQRMLDSKRLEEIDVLKIEINKLKNQLDDLNGGNE